MQNRHSVEPKLQKMLPSSQMQGYQLKKSKPKQPISSAVKTSVQIAYCDTVNIEVIYLLRPKKRGPTCISLTGLHDYMMIIIVKLPRLMFARDASS